MYMSQHAFTPAPAKFDRWIPYNRNYMSLTARVPGAVLSRILREVREPEKFLAVGVWTGHEAAARWAENPENKLGAQPNIDLGLYDGYPMTWSRWRLVDVAWGLEGPAADPKAAFVKIVTWDVAPGAEAAQAALNRAVLSLLARQPGFICGETYLAHRNDRFQLIYTFAQPTAWPFGGDLPADLRLLVQSDAAAALRAEAAEPAVLDATVWDWVWGPERDRLHTAIDAMPAVADRKQAVGAAPAA
jgi:heme-degrading monooxygenase HmoA